MESLNITDVTQNKLNTYFKQGFISHGSPRYITGTLNPNKSHDPHNEFNTDNTLFASTQPAAAIIIACISEVILPPLFRRRSWSVNLTPQNQLLQESPDHGSHSLEKQQDTYMYLKKIAFLKHKCGK